jgi:formate dehydrogenase assembly factor FdhD
MRLDSMVGSGQRLVTMLCSPFQVEALVVGYLGTERVIQRIEDISRVEVSLLDGRAEVELVTRFVPGAALDKLKGRALLDGRVTADRILVSSGRISSEMLLRVARMGTPVVASRTSPTDMAIALAKSSTPPFAGTSEREASTSTLEPVWSSTRSR